MKLKSQIYGRFFFTLLFQHNQHEINVCTWNSIASTLGSDLQKHNHQTASSNNNTVLCINGKYYLCHLIVCPADVHLLQLDVSKVVQWAKTWLLRLKPDKCESIVLSNKRSPPVPHYYLDTELISSKPVIHYLGILACQLPFKLV